MITAVVSFHVIKEYIDKFKEASLANAKSSRREPGVRGFEVMQQQDDQSRFVFIEMFASPEAQLSHRETAHYKLWKSTVEEFFAEPRTLVNCNVIE